MECDCAKKITERLFREYGALTANTFVYESPMTVSKILYTLAGATPPPPPPYILGPKLHPAKPIGNSGIARREGSYGFYYDKKNCICLTSYIIFHTKTFKFLKPESETSTTFNVNCLAKLC